MQEEKAYLGVNEVARLFKVDPTTVRAWCRRGLLYFERLGPDSPRRVYADTILAFVRSKGTPVETLDQKLWRTVQDMASRTKPVVDYPMVLVADVTGRIKTASEGIGYVLGYELSDLLGSQVDLKLSLRDEETGVPLLFRAIGRLSVEPARVKWASYNSEHTGLAWITPLRVSSSDICGWAITLDSLS